MESQDGIKNDARAVPPLKILLHAHGRVKDKILAQGYRRDSLHAAFKRAVLQHEFEQLISQPEMLHFWKDVHGQELGDGSPGCVQGMHLLEIRS